MAGRETRKGCPMARRPGVFMELSVPQFPAGAQGEHGEREFGSEARPRVLFHSASVPLSRQSRRRPPARWRRPESGLRGLAVPAQRADAQPRSHRGGTDRQPALLGPIPDRPEPPLSAATERQVSRDLPPRVTKGPAPGKRLAVDWWTGRGRSLSSRLLSRFCPAARSHTLACFPRGYRPGLKAERGG